MTDEIPEYLPKHYLRCSDCTDRLKTMSLDADSINKFVCGVCGVKRNLILRNFEHNLEEFCKIAREEIGEEHVPLPKDKSISEFGDLNNDEKHIFRWICPKGHYLCPKCWLITVDISKGTDFFVRTNGATPTNRIPFTVLADPEDYDLDMDFVKKQVPNDSNLQERFEQIAREKHKVLNIETKSEEALKEESKQTAEVAQGLEIHVYKTETFDGDYFVGFIPDLQ